jgi:hypothetical protein
MSFAIGQWIRDTSIKIKTQSLSYYKQGLDNIQNSMAIYSGKNRNINQYKFSTLG